MIRLVTFLFLSILFSACQETPEQVDFVDCERLNYDPLYNHYYETERDKPYSGVCKVFYQGGKLMQYREMKDGKNNGKYEYYSPEGVLLEEGTFLDNLHHGVFKYYDEQGSLKQQAEFYYGNLKE
jgi:antitoxin component YwqK of YwqJK toxin-antitoxin module